MSPRVLHSSPSELGHDLGSIWARLECIWWALFWGVTAPIWALTIGKRDSEKVWPEQEEAHEHEGHQLDKGVEDLEDSEERAYSLNQPCRLTHERLWEVSGPLTKDFTVLKCEPLTILLSFLCVTSRGWMRWHVSGWETLSEEGCLCTLFCCCFFPRHLSPVGPCTGALNLCVQLWSCWILSLCIEHVLKCLPKLYSQGNKQLNGIITPLVPLPVGSRGGCVDELKKYFQGSGFLPDHLLH